MDLSTQANLIRFFEQNPDGLLGFRVAMAGRVDERLRKHLESYTKPAPYIDAVNHALVDMKVIFSALFEACPQDAERLFPGKNPNPVILLEQPGVHILDLESMIALLRYFNQCHSDFLKFKVELGKLVDGETKKQLGPFIEPKAYLEALIKEEIPKDTIIQGLKNSFLKKLAREISEIMGETIEKREEEEESKFNLICGLCMDRKKDRVLNCGHAYCKECLGQVQEANGPCPGCRGEITRVSPLFL